MMGLAYHKMRQEDVARDLNHLADQMAEGPASDYYHAAWAEMCRRHAEWQQMATQAQANTAIYIFWSMMAIMVTSCLNAFFEFLVWIAPHTG